MPEVKVPSLNQDVKIILWSIDEPIDWFLKQTILTQDEITENFSMLGKRRLEYVVQRYLIQSFYPKTVPLIKKTDNGKPYLFQQAEKISISHTKQFLAASISHENHGIDLEIPDERIVRLAGKFCNSEELEVPEGVDQVLWYTLVWSFKESLYKSDGLGQLDFRRDLAVHFTKNDIDNKRGHGIVSRGRQKTFYRLYFVVLNRLVLTVAYPSFM